MECIYTYIKYLNNPIVISESVQYDNIFNRLLLNQIECFIIKHHIAGFKQMTPYID